MSRSKASAAVAPGAFPAGGFVIEAGTRRISVRPQQLLEIVSVLAVRDFRAKYKQSLLGPIWLVLQPAALLAAFVLAFRQVATFDTSGVPYLVFVLIGLGAWTFFQQTLNMGGTSLVSNTGLISKTPCPRIAFPLASLAACSPSLLLPLVCGTVGALASDKLSARVVLLPLPILWLAVLTFASVTLVSAITVRIRDAMAVLPLILQVGVFFSPIGYPTSHLSAGVRAALALNPLTGLIESLRWVMLPVPGPSALEVCLSVAVTLLIAGCGWLVFSRSEATMADVV